MYALMLVGLLILFFLPRYWLLLAFVIVTAAISGLALHDAWIGAQSLRTPAGQPLLPNELFWQSRSLWEALVRQSVFVVIGGALVAIRKRTLAGRSQAAGHETGQTTNVEPTTPEKPSEDLPLPTPQTGPSGVLSSSSDATSPPAGLNWSQGLRRVFLVLSVIWWCVALILMLPRAIEEFPSRSSVYYDQLEACEFIWEPVEEDECIAQLRSASGQEREVPFRAAVWSWTKSFLLFLGVIVMLPFATAVAFIAIWRVYCWTRDGFKQKA